MNDLTPKKTLAAVTAELAALRRMSVGELAAKHLELFGIPAKGRNKPFLQKKLAYKIQELAFGGLSPRALDRIAVLAPAKPTPVPVAPAPMPPERDPRLPPVGTILQREHGGRVHEVLVHEDGGFRHAGRRFASLSAVARDITGTRWNGLAFFGLTGRTGATS